jgi:hypothetical protein
MEHVALTGDMRGAYRILVGRPEGKRKDLSVDWRIVIKWCCMK